MPRIYLDNNATTKTDPKVLEAMQPFFCEMYGNPNSLHEFGMEVRAALSKAMDQLYNGIHATDDDDVIAVGCATEANNSVLMAVWHDLIIPKKQGRTEIIVSQIEHPAVLETARFLEERCGVTVHRVPINVEGFVDVEALSKFLSPKTALVSIMWANNETGIINPIADLCKAAHEAGALFHSDAVQAIGKVDVNVAATGVDYLSFSAHKFHGPKGVGGLFIKKGAPFTPLLHGGEHMGGLRSGTLNVPGIIGMGLAIEMAQQCLDKEWTEVQRLRNKLEDAILALTDTTVIGRRDIRTPNTVLASFKGVEGEALLWDLNQNGIAASTGSACASESLEASVTLQAMSISADLAHTGIRFSLSRYNTEAEIDTTIQVLSKAVLRLRAISGQQQEV